MLLPASLLRLASDERLVEQVRAGSERAFEALLDRHHRSVLAFCLQMLGSREEAEDAAQQTFLAAYRHLIGSKAPIALRPWLYTIARHRCVSVLRARRDRRFDDVPRRSTDTVAAEVSIREDLRATEGAPGQRPRKPARPPAAKGHDWPPNARPGHGRPIRIPCLARMRARRPPAPASTATATVLGDPDRRGRAAV